MPKKLKIQSAGRPDNFQTPKCAIDILIPFIKKEWDIWEPAWGKGNLFNFLKEEGYNIIGSDVEFDFLTGYKECDCIITNPPYSIKDKFISRCYELKKPFALLMPLTALEGQKRQYCYKKYGLQLIIPNKRINFETPSGKGKGAWFMTAWFCWGLNLPQQLNFVELY
mgnify:CR=1 FL=1